MDLESFKNGFSSPGERYTKRQIVESIKMTFIDGKTFSYGQIQQLFGQKAKIKGYYVGESCRVARELTEEELDFVISMIGMPQTEMKTMARSTIKVRRIPKVRVLKENNDFIKSKFCPEPEIDRKALPEITNISKNGILSIAIEFKELEKRNLPKCKTMFYRLSRVLMESEQVRGEFFNPVFGLTYEFQSSSANGILFTIEYKDADEYDFKYIHGYLLKLKIQSNCINLGKVKLYTSTTVNALVNSMWWETNV